MIPSQASEVSLWAKATADMGGCLVFTYLNSARPSKPGLRLGTEYQQFTVTFPGGFTKQAASTLSVVISCGGSTAGGSLFLDDITLTQVVQ